MGRRLALLIATYDYQDPGLGRLTAPTHDAEALTGVLRDPDIGGFEVTTLVNAKHHRVGEAIGDLYRDRRRDDLTLLYFTGHGLKDDAGRLYLATADTRCDNLRFTAVSAADIDGAMSDSRSRSKLLILDCCYSGAFPHGTFAKAGTDVHALDSFRGHGRAVLTASDATQYAFEDGCLLGETVGVLPRSVFTRHLVAGLSDGSADEDLDGDITVDELYDYVYDRVVAESPRQQPKCLTDVRGRMVVARNINWTPPAHLVRSLGSPLAAIRLAALPALDDLHRKGNAHVRERIAAEYLRLTEDDSRSVSEAAAEWLAAHEAVPPGAAEEPRAAVPPAVEEPRADVPPAVEEPRADMPPTVEEPRADVPPTVEEPRADVPPTVEEPRADMPPGAAEEPRADMPPGEATVGERGRDQRRAPVGERRRERAPAPEPGAAPSPTATPTSPLAPAPAPAPGRPRAAAERPPRVGPEEAGRAAELDTRSGQDPLDVPEWVKPMGGSLAATPQDERSAEAKAATSGTGRRSGGPASEVVLVAELLGASGHADLVEFSPDGRLLAAGGAKGSVWLWSMPTCRLVRRLSADGLSDLSLSSDGSMLAIADGAGQAVVQSLTHPERRGQRLPTVSVGGAMTQMAVYLALIENETKPGPSLVAFSPVDPTRVATAKVGGSAQLWALRRDREPARKSPGVFGVSAMAFAPSGDLLATCGVDGHIGVWRVPTGRRHSAIKPDRGTAIRAAAFSPGDSVLATGDDDGRVWIWRVGARGGLVDTAFGDSGPITSLAYSPDGSLLACGSADGFRMAATVGYAPAHPLPASPIGGLPVRSVAFSPTEPLLATASSDGRVRLWNISALTGR
ncbi:caspase family protein [Streptomyces sp. NPDC049040]|uniref:caspase, EACC1-associated type n=1 Tax=Streptomyces sp. NPDC049040 TaxID=3365593 RepID=UPI0037151F91